MFLWLSGLPTAVSLPLVIAVYAAMAVAVCLIAHRIFAYFDIDLGALEPGPVGNIVALIGTAAATLLGFAIVNLWLNFRTVQVNVIREGSIATTLHEYFALYPKPVEIELDRKLAIYVQAIVSNEFPALARGERPRDDDSSEEQLRAMLLNPKLPQLEAPFRSLMLQRFATMIDLRHERLAQGGTVITSSLWIAMFGTGLLTLLGCVFLNISNLRVKLTMLGLAAAGYGIMMYVVIQFNHPYAGDTSIGPQPFIDALRAIRPGNGVIP